MDENNPGPDDPTSITCTHGTKARLDEYRDRPWDAFLQYMLDELEEYADNAEDMADLLAAGARAEYGGGNCDCPTAGEVRAIVEASSSGGLTPDEVRTIVRDEIRSATQR